MDRRRFLTASAALPLALSATGRAHASSNRRLLVLVELAGGNDGLNTVVPFADPAYHRLRPRLGLARDTVLKLDERLGLHPAMAPLMPLFEDGEMGVVLGVGYPRPNRSHFRSIEIWDSASESDEVVAEGWLSAAYRGAGRPAPLGISLGNGSGPLAGPGMRAISMADPERFLKRAGRLRAAGRETINPALSHLIGVRARVLDTAGEIETGLARAPQLRASFPGGRFGRSMNAAARLIAADVGVSAIKVTHGGFDTHRGQAGTHARLLKELAEGLAAFRGAMMETGDWNRVLIATYSEFGRRVAENGSAGTDHGTAAPHFVLGGRVRGGLHGAQPGLADLERGDLKHGTDFRAYYATLGQSWLGLPAGAVSAVADGHRPLPLLRGA